MEARPWHAQLAPRIRHDLPLKVLGISAFMTLFFIAYFHLLNHPLGPTTVMPFTALDRAVPFYPPALPVYFSLWVYVTLPPSLIDDRAALVRYGCAIAAVCAAGLAIFLAWPTAVPQRTLDWQGFPGSELLQGIDKAGNACPSLHVATAMFSALGLQRILRAIRAPRGLRVANALWAAAIVYSTLATRQHVAVDALAGGALGVAGAWLLARWERHTALSAG